MVRTFFFLQFTTFISAPNLEQATAGFCNEENLTGIREYGAAWASGDMERLQAVLAPDFTLTVEGEDAAVARDDLPAFYANSREQATLSFTFNLNFDFFSLVGTAGWSRLFIR